MVLLLLCPLLLCYLLCSCGEKTKGLYTFSSYISDLRIVLILLWPYHSSFYLISCDYDKYSNGLNRLPWQGVLSLMRPCLWSNTQSVESLHNILIYSSFCLHDETVLIKPMATNPSHSWWIMHMCWWAQAESGFELNLKRHSCASLLDLPNLRSSQFLFSSVDSPKKIKQA